MKDWLIKAYATSLGDAQRMMEDVECADCARIVHNVNKHPAWVVGHLAVAGDLIVGVLGGEATLEAWHPLFAPTPEAAPVDDRAKYPTKAELMDALGDRHRVVGERMAGLNEAGLDAALPIEAYREFWPTVRDALGDLMALHEPYHLGQLSQWKRAAGITG